jgi:hypothetical protein
MPRDPRSQQKEDGRLKLFALLVLGLPLLHAQLTMSKSFPGSVPAYSEVRIDADGKCEYREDPKDEEPLKFQISSQDRQAMWDLAEKLGHFTRPLESGLKVAHMGDKTFRWEKNEVTFNYSEDEDAKALLDWYEKICETERAYIALETAAKYDKLGVEKALLQLEISWDNKRIVAPQQMLPMLDRIVKNEGFMHMARNRAADLADAMRKGKK